jgi:hypothetical protein
VEKDFKKNLKTERVVILTEEALIEGTLFHHLEVRLSDALNAPMFRDSPYLSLSDAQVTRIDSSEPILQSKFLLVSRNRILCITPKSEVLSIPSLPAAPVAERKTIPQPPPVPAAAAVPSFQVPDTPSPQAAGNGPAGKPEAQARPLAGASGTPLPRSRTQARESTERRVAPRRRGNLLPVLITNGDTKVPPFEGWVLDRSAGGIRLLVKNTVAEGTTLAVRPVKAASSFPWLSVEVRNCTSNKGKIHLGCRFLQKSSIEELQQFG